MFFKINKKERPNGHRKIFFDKKIVGRRPQNKIGYLHESKPLIQPRLNLNPPLHSETNTRMANLERKLYFKQLQINRLLEITQAINSNVKIPDLYRLYQETLAQVMGATRLMLIVQADGAWEAAVSMGLEEKPHLSGIEQFLLEYTKITKLTADKKHPLLSKFEVVVPVFHKQTPLAFAFIGGLEDESDFYERIQFITTITNIITVAIENKRLFKQQLEQEKMRRELAVAAKVQKMLIPALLPQEPHLEMAGIYQPFHGVGGDYYDFIVLDERRSVFCIADVSGKGIGAALLMSNVQANLHALLSQDLSAEQLVSRLNKSIFRITGGDRFVTMFLAMYDRGSRDLTYVNAGHVPPIYCAGGGNRRLDKGCPILGAFEQLPFLEVGSLSVADGGFLVAFTDGLTDLLDEKDEFYGESRLLELASRHADGTVAEFNELLLRDMNEFRRASDYTDDISILTCRFYSEK